MECSRAVAIGACVRAPQYTHAEVRRETAQSSDVCVCCGVVRRRILGRGCQAEQKGEHLLCVFLNPTAEWSHVTLASQKILPTLTPSSKVCREPAHTSAGVRRRTCVLRRAYVRRARTKVPTGTRVYSTVCVRAVAGTESRAMRARFLFQISYCAMARGMPGIPL